jgi:hypothetical protein
MLETELKRLPGEVKRAVGKPDAAEKLADVQGRMATAEGRLGAVTAELGALESMRIDEADVDRAMRAFDPVWEVLSPAERGRLLDLLIETVEFKVVACPKLRRPPEAIAPDPPPQAAPDPPPTV